MALRHDLCWVLSQSVALPPCGLGEDSCSCCQFMAVNGPSEAVEGFALIHASIHFLELGPAARERKNVCPIHGCSPFDMLASSWQSKFSFYNFNYIYMQTHYIDKLNCIHNLR